MGRDYDVAFRHLRDEGDDLVLLVLAGLVLEVRVGVLDERAEFTGLDVSGRLRLGGRRLAKRILRLGQAGGGPGASDEEQDDEDGAGGTH